MYDSSPADADNLSEYMHIELDRAGISFDCFARNPNGPQCPACFGTGRVPTFGYLRNEARATATLRPCFFAYTQ